MNGYISCDDRNNILRFYDDLRDRRTRRKRLRVHGFKFNIYGELFDNIVYLNIFESHPNNLVLYESIDDEPELKITFQFSKKKVAEFTQPWDIPFDYFSSKDKKRNGFIFRLTLREYVAVTIPCFK